MKSLRIIFFLFLLTSLSCQQKEEGFNSSQLKGTQWKLAGFFDPTSNTLKVAEPKDCNDCYTLNFDTDSTATGKSILNYIWVNLSRKNPIGVATEIGEITGDGKLFCDIVSLVNSYTLDESGLKFYYQQNHYLLFKKIK